MTTKAPVMPEADGTTNPKQSSGDGAASEERKLFTILVVIIDIINMLGQMFISIVESTFRIFYPAPLKPVRGEIILITGTGHGMGRELALQYADLGATIVCVDINEENNSKTIKEIEAKHPSKAFGYICDVSDADAVKQLAEKVQKEVGVVSVLVNNAGIMPCRQLLSYTPNDIKKLFGVNVFAHIWLMQNFLPGMLEKNRGHIIALSSVAGVVGLENLAPYCSTKFAVRGLMEAISEELRLKVSESLIRFTIIYPYMVDTGLCKKPVIKFPSILSMVKTQEAARQIIEAHRRNVLELSIPSYLLTLNSVLRFLPYKGALAFKDFMGSTIDEDD